MLLNSWQMIHYFFKMSTYSKFNVMPERTIVEKYVLERVWTSSKSYLHVTYINKYHFKSYTAYYLLVLTGHYF